MMRDRRLTRLVAAHGVASLLAAGWARNWEPIVQGTPHWDIVPIVGLLLAQGCLLGSWAVLSERPGRIRWLGFFLGCVDLVILNRIAIPEDAYPVMPPLTAVEVVGLLWLARVARGGRRRLDGNGPSSAPRKIGQRSSIRSLMLLSAVAALAAAAVRSLGGPPDPVPLMGLCALGFAAVGLAALWAALGQAPPWTPRRLLVLLVAPALPLLVYEVSLGPISTVIVLLLAAIGALQAAVLLGSLLVVRSCGYRLGGKPSPATDPDLATSHLVGP